MLTVTGKVIEGYGVASGKNKNSPYPESSLKLQLSHFKKLGLNLNNYFLGTLNISIKPYQFELKKSYYYFPQVKWFQDIEEDFSFSPIKLSFKENTYQGWLYYPHPETKPNHFQGKSTMELILPYIQGITYGDEVTVSVNEQEITFI